MQANCPGVVITDTAGVPRCEDGAGVALVWEPATPFDPTSIDPVVASKAFAAGFVIVGTCWAIGRGFRVLLNMIGR